MVREGVGARITNTKWLGVLVLLVAILALYQPTKANAATPTGSVINSILREYHSPLDGEYIAQFWREHRSLNIASILALWMRESSLLTAGASVWCNNPGNLHQSRSTNPWQQVASGTYRTSSGEVINRYPSINTGSWAGMMLIVSRYGGNVVTSDRYFRYLGYTSWWRYEKLKAARATIVREARERGFYW